MKPSDLGFDPQRFPDFRRYLGFDQLETAREIAQSSERFHIFNLPTGCGKSLLYATAARLLGGRFLVLVATKGLQAQVLGDGLVDHLVYGHRNYPCAMKSRFGTTMDDADADDPDFRCGVPRDLCGYLQKVEAAKSGQSVIANNAYWMSIGRYSDPGLLGEFDFLVCDEASNLPAWLAKAVSINITPGRLRKYLGTSVKLPPYSTTPYARVDGWRDWAADCGLRLLGQRKHIAREDMKKFDRLVADVARLAEVADSDSFRTAGYTEPWVVVPYSNGDGVQFSPRWGSDFAERYLFRGIPKVLLTSATVTPHHARYLGIPADQMRYKEIPSPFDVRRRPVVWVPTTRVDYRMSDGQRWKLRQRVDEVIEAAIVQGAGNGIIHTGSYERNREITQGSRFGPAIITHTQDSASFQSALEKFKQAGREGRFAVMASPRMVEGVDLPGDEARWQLIIKVPFPDGRDPLTKARAADPDYRNMVVAEAIMQMSGRVVRGAEDFATTIMLDNHWGDHVARQCPWPDWFRRGFQVVRIDQGESLVLLTRTLIDAMVPERRVQLIGAI